MLPYYFKISNVQVVNEDSVQESLDVWVRDGQIEQMVPHASLKSDEQHEVIEADNLALIPAGVDLQIHLRTPGQSEKEIPRTGLRAALRGGYSLVLAMPNTNPVMDNPALLNQVRDVVAQAEKETGVEVMHSVAITKGLEGRELSDFAGLLAAKADAFTDDGVGVENDDLMVEAFRQLENTDVALLQHAEFRGHGGILAPGPVQSRLEISPYPDSAEWKMVERDIRALEKHPGARYHVLHVSCQKTVELVSQAKAKGLRVTCEVTPHHLFFSSEDIQEKNTSFKMNPPLRGEADRRYLVKALEEGFIDFVSTDHAPHEKKLKGEDFRASAFGTTGLETALRVLVTLYQRNELSLSRLVQVFSSEAARFAKKQNKYGALSVGREFNAVLLDLKALAKPVELKDLESLSQNNVFLGASLGGQIKAVFNSAGTFRF